MRHNKPRSSEPILTSVFLITVIVLLGVILIRVIFIDSDIPVSSAGAEVAAVANERLFQLAQWAIGSVLTIGIALIGFNWVQTNRDREEVNEAMNDVEQRTLNLAQRQEQLTNELTSLVERSLAGLEKRKEEFETEYH